MNEKKKTMRAVIEIVIAVLAIIAVYFIIRGMDRHDAHIRQEVTNCRKRYIDLRIRFRPIFLSEQTKAEMKTPAGKNIVDQWPMH